MAIIERSGLFEDCSQRRQVVCYTTRNSGETEGLIIADIVCTSVTDRVSIFLCLSVSLSPKDVYPASSTSCHFSNFDVEKIDKQ